MTFICRDAPARIVCLTEEPTEILYALGEEARIVGISAYTERPAEAKRDKPVVSAFIGGSVSKISALKPDLIIGFSDIQADLARDLIKANLPVMIFNQRSIQEILDVILQIGRIVGRGDAAKALVEKHIAHLEEVRAEAAKLPRRPKVYFEEWDEPLISAIEWVGELIEIAGGENVFAERAAGKLASERFVTHDEIILRRPDFIGACWCGKPVDVSSIVSRAGYDVIPAVIHGDIVEFDPAILLQPGPACLSDGVDALAKSIAAVAKRPLGS